MNGVAKPLLPSKALWHNMLRINSLLRLLMAITLSAILATATYAREGNLSASNYEYTGGVADGKQNGFGICRYKNGNVYIGNWKMGYKSGKGLIRFADGTMDFGTWVQGTLAKQPGRKFKVGKKCYGIDVAKYQKTVRWENLALHVDAEGNIATGKKKTRYRQPVLFALMKSTEGITIIDPFFKRNFREAKHCGIIRGAYHFLSVNSPVEEQVKFFIENTPLEPGDLPPVLDLEISKRVMEQQHDKVIKMAKKWLREVEKHYGVKPIIYTYNNYYLKYMKGHGLDGYDYWIARYGAEPSARHWEIWQLTDKGRCDGINHAVDIDIFNGTYSDLVEYVRKHPIKIRKK